MYPPKPAYVPTKEEWTMLTGWLDRDIRLKAEATIRENLVERYLLFGPAATGPPLGDYRL